MPRTRYDERTLRRAKADYDSGLTLPVVAAAFGMSYANLNYLFKRRGWPLRKVGEKKNLRMKYYDPAPVMDRLVAWDLLDTQTKGLVAEQAVVVWLLQFGMDVWRPLSAQHCCDLGVLVDGRLVKLQVKAATYDRDKHFFSVHLNRNNRGQTRLRYDPRRVDFYVVFCPGLPEPTFYVLPTSGTYRGERARFYPHRQHFQCHQDFENNKNAIGLLRKRGKKSAS